MDYLFNNRHIILCPLDEISLPSIFVEREFFLTTQTYCEKYNWVVDLAVEEFGEFIEIILFKLAASFESPAEGGLHFRLKMYATRRFDPDETQILVTNHFSQLGPILETKVGKVSRRNLTSLFFNFRLVLFRHFTCIAAREFGCEWPRQGFKTTRTLSRSHCVFGLTQAKD